ncbi:MAG: hypothetical protein ABSA75_01575 [Candidatus Bathyarchaeia archaeon]|jgi:hypothetical protein
MGRKEGIKKFLILWLAFFIIIFVIAIVVTDGFNPTATGNASASILIVGFGLASLFCMVPASMIVSWKWGFKDFMQCQNCKNGNHESCTKPYEPIPYDDGVWHCCCVEDEIIKVKTSLMGTALQRLASGQSTYDQIMKVRDSTTVIQGGTPLRETHPPDKLFFTPPFPSHYTINKRMCNACRMGFHQECHSPNVRVDEIGQNAWTCCCNNPISSALWMDKKREAEGNSTETLARWQSAWIEGSKERSRQEQADRNSGGSW